MDSNGFPDEKYITAAAFLMFIATSILQNRELAYQREDVQLNRESLTKQVEELKFQRDELEKQTKEFKETNQYNKESLELTQFFEMLTLREETYLAVVNRSILTNHRKDVLEYYKYLDYNLDNKNYIEQFNLIVLKAIEEKISLSNTSKELSKKDIEIMKMKFKELVDGQELLTSLEIEVPSLLMKLYSYNKILDNLVHEVSESKSLLFGDMFKNISNAFNKSLKIRPGLRYKRSDIYELVVSEDEKFLKKIIDSEIEFEDVLRLSAE